MPNYKTHLMAGVLSFALIMKTTSMYMPTFNLPIEYLPLAFFLSLVGSIFPDIDVPSKMQKWFFITSIGGILITLLAKQHILFTILGTSIVFVAFLTHRTITHKPVFLLLLGLLPTLYVCYKLPQYASRGFALYIYFSTGCLSHILLDKLMTKMNKMLGKTRRWR